MEYRIVRYPSFFMWRRRILENTKKPLQKLRSKKGQHVQIQSLSLPSPLSLSKQMASAKPFATAAGTLRSRLSTSLRLRGGGAGPSRWTSPGHQEHPNGYFLNRTPLPPGQSRKWEDWELPCYVTSFLTIVILGVGLNAKPDLTIETWAHQKALERLEAQQMAPLSDESDWDCGYGLKFGRCSPNFDGVN